MAKKCIIVILLFALLVSNSIQVYSSETDVISNVEISYLNIATIQTDVMQFITGTAQNSEECPWDGNTVVSEIIPMTDFDGNTNAYIFNLTTIGQPTGYIFYDANSDSPGVQEYGYEGQYYLSNMEQFKSREADDQIIYAGGRSFLLQKGTQFYDMNSNERILLTKQSMNHAYKQNIAKAREVKAQQLEHQATQANAQTRAVTVSYPSAWTILNLWIPDDWDPVDMADYAKYGGSGNCARTSALNYTKYYLERRGINIMVVNNLVTTYQYISRYVPLGPSTVNLYYGFINYCNSINKPAVGRDYVSYGSTYFNYEWFQRNLYNNHMLIMGVTTASYTYGSEEGDHALNAVGYEYNASNHTDYIRVADQWDNSVSHFYRFNGGVNIYGAFYLRWQ